MFVKVYAEFRSSFDEIIAIDAGGKALRLHFLAHGGDLQADNAFVGAYQGSRGDHSGDFIAGVEGF